MADAIGTAYVNIQPKADGIQGKITNAISPGATGAGKTAGGQMAQSMSGTIKTTGAKLMKTGAIVSAFAVPLVAGVKGALSAYQQQMEAEVKLQEIYKTRLGATKDQTKATLQLTSAQQKLGVVGDEVQIAGAQQLATFMTTTKSVDALIPSMNNLLVQQHGLNATQGDAVNVANLMGKVMNGQVGALRRVGISFTDAQEKVLKYGTEEEKVSMLAEVINQNVGNMNEAMANTPLGKIQQAKNNFGDLVEVLGGMLAPVLSKVATWLNSHLVPALQKLMAWMGKHPMVAKLALAFTGIVTAGGPLLIILGSIFTAIGTITGAITAISLPIVGLVAGIAGVVAILITAYKNSESFRKAVQTLGSGIKTFLAGAINLIKPLLQTLWALFNKVANVVGVVLTPIIRALGKAFSVVGGIFTTFGTKIAPIKEKIQGLGEKFGSVKDKIVSAGGRIKEVGATIAKPFTTAWEKIKGAWDKITGIFPIKMGKIFSGIKLPHFRISGGEIPWGIGGMGKKPSVDIEWYAKGGIVDGATLIGAGERGAEAIVPLDPFWKRLDALAENMHGNTTINVYASDGMDVVAVAREVERRLIASTQRREMAWR